MDMSEGDVQMGDASPPPPARAPRPAPYDLRPRRRSQETPQQGPPVRRDWDLAMFLTVLRTAHALGKDMDHAGLAAYNNGWKWFLASAEVQIKEVARRVPHRKEIVDDVWKRILAELETPGAIMLAIHLAYEEAMGRELIVSDAQDPGAAVAKYFHEKEVFRRQADRLKVQLIKKIKDAKRRMEKGYDPAREIAWNERTQIASEYRRTINAEIQRYEQMIKLAQSAIEQRRAQIEKFDPALHRALARIEPSEQQMSRWYAEFAAMDPNIKDKDWQNEVEQYISYCRRNHMEDAKKRLLNDDAAWADFCSIEKEQLTRELRRRERALEQLRVSEYAQMIERCFPEFDQTLSFGLDPNSDDDRGGPPGPRNGAPRH